MEDMRKAIMDFAGNGNARYLVMKKRGVTSTVKRKDTYKYWNLQLTMFSFI